MDYEPLPYLSVAGMDVKAPVGLDKIAVLIVENMDHIPTATATVFPRLGKAGFKGAVVDLSQVDFPGLSVDMSVGYLIMLLHAARYVRFTGIDPSDVQPELRDSHVKTSSDLETAVDDLTGDMKIVPIRDEPSELSY
jgi:hypothetical protein